MSQVKFIEDAFNSREYKDLLLAEHRSWMLGILNKCRKHYDKSILGSYEKKNISSVFDYIEKVGMEK